MDVRKEIELDERKANLTLKTTKVLILFPCQKRWRQSEVGRLDAVVISKIISAVKVSLIVWNLILRGRVSNLTHIIK